jgi:hypothetical protein
MKKIYFFTGISILLILVSPIIGNTQTSIEKSITNKDLSIQIDKKDASGKNSSDGYIYIKVNGGEGPYSINVFSTAIPFQNVKANELKLDNIPSGTYLVIVQDKSLKIIRETVELAKN